MKSNLLSKSLEKKEVVKKKLAESRNFKKDLEDSS
jgi:hypothetical protein